MINIPLKVTGNQLIQEETVNIASGCSNSVQVTLAIDHASDFADSTLKKRAVFRYYQGSYFISDVDENNQVVVPKFVIAYPYFKVALRAQNEDKTLTITTNEIQIPVDKSPMLYESTIVDGDVNIRNGDGTLAISKSGDVVYINFVTSYKEAVDAVLAGTYATASALNSVANDVDLIKDDIINMSTSISDLQGDIEELDNAKADKTDVYTKGETEGRLAEKQPVGDYATNTDLDNLETRVSEVETNKADKSEVSEVANDIANIKNGTTHLFENITDSHGNPRFVEGDITIRPIAGITQIYGKWSLSGSHLMIVIVIDMKNVTLANNDLAFISLPAYITDKITPLWRFQYVDREAFTAWTDSGNSTNISCYFSKSDNNIGIKFQSTASITTLSHMRIQFDLLIDAS